MHITRLHITAILMLTCSLIFWWSLPETLFDVPYSTVIYADDGQLLGATIAEDGQWRFAESQSIPRNFEMCLLHFEDRRFHRHWGVDARAMVRAFRQNVAERRIVSGASTITMQVAKLSRNPERRTISQKLREICLALRIECSFSKQEILQMWAAHAPMGGNVVGLEAASWRYYGTSPDRLSLAECATIAILPNAPALMHPGRNRQALRDKRDRLLLSLKEAGKIDQLSYELALLEDIPAEPTALPRLAPHLLHQVVGTGSSQRLQTTLSHDLQDRAIQIAERHHQHLSASGIENLAILVAEVNSGEVLAYVANAPQTRAEQDVDMIQAARSSGSILKPILYTAALDAGHIAPAQLLPDVPSDYDGFRPRNYTRDYDGAVPADEVISRSLNVPSIHLMQQYGVPRLLADLKRLGLSTINRDADHYGLSLILGGAEVSLWEICGLYRNMAHDLNTFAGHSSQYLDQPYGPLTYQTQEITDDIVYTHEPRVYAAGAIHHAMQAMTQLSRPAAEGHWERFESSIPLSWKTGTSFGHRDAWAVGVNADYVIGIWVGNADGEGRSGLVGVKKAAPILFDVLHSLGPQSSLPVPHDDLRDARICRHSGMVASDLCDEVDTFHLSQRASHRPCLYHRKIYLDSAGYLALRDCAEGPVAEQSHFALPPEMAHYYKRVHPEYSDLPEIAPSCLSMMRQRNMSLVYPYAHTSIYLPKDERGDRQMAMARAVHARRDATIHWHLDDDYLGSTKDLHQQSIATGPGEHQLVLVDDRGEEIMQTFVVVN